MAPTAPTAPPAVPCAAGDGYIELDAELRVVFISAGAAELLRSSSSGPAVSRDAASSSFAGVRERTGPRLGERLGFGEEACARARDEGHAVAFDARVAIAGAPARWLRGRAYRSPSGVSLYVSDVTARRGDEERLQLLRASVAHLRDSVLVMEWIDADTPPRVVYANHAFLTRTGLTEQEALGASPLAFGGPHTDPATMNALREGMTRGEVVRVLLHPDPRSVEVGVELVATPMRDDAGTITHYVTVARDVSARLRVEAELRATAEKLTTTQRIARVGGWEWDIVEDRLTWTSELFEHAAGDGPVRQATCEEYLRLVHPEDRERLHAVLQAALADDAPYAVTLRLVAGGQVRTFDVRGEVVRDPSGRPLRVSGTMIDSTDRRRTEQQLAETNRALRILSRCNEALIRSENEQELLATVCRVAVEEGGFRLAWVGYANDEPERAVRVVASAGVDDGYLANLRTSIDAERPEGRGPIAVVLRTGKTVVVPDFEAHPAFAPWIDAARARGFRGAVCLPLKNGDETFGVLGLYLPEARPPADTELRALQELADNLAFGILNLRSQADRRRLQAALQKVAESASASTGADFFEQLALHMCEAVGADAGMITRFSADGRTGDAIAAVVDGRPVATFSYPLDGSPCGALARGGDDCLAERGGPVGEALQALLFGAALPAPDVRPDAWVARRLDASDGTPIGAFFALFRNDRASAEFVASTLRIFATRAAVELERQKADARVREQASLLDSAQDAIFVADLDLRVDRWNKSAERRYGWTSSEAVGRTLPELLGEPELFAKALAVTTERGEWVGAFDVVTKSGARIPEEGRWTLVRDDNAPAAGGPKAILAVHSDRSERKQLERTEAQLRQSQKMEAIGSLAGGVAHDFNNLLTVILSYATMIHDELAPSDPLRADVDAIRGAGLRASALTRQLLAFSRKQVLQPVVLDVNAILGGLRSMLDRLLGAPIKLVFTLGKVGSVLADAGQLEQVVMNLAVNARDAMATGGRLVLETDEVGADGVPPEVPPPPGGRYVRITVSDSGTGMSEATQLRIFEPFFTTKGAGEGTGLGLSTVYGIVQQSGGHITVTSAPGRGTTFQIFLPRVGSGPWPAVGTRPSTPPSSPQARRGHEPILLVEDDAAVRSILVAILTKQGYEVLEAQNAGEAILICEQEAREIPLLITDVVMPRLSGRQLADRLRPLRPAMQVLFISGYATEALALTDPGVHFLPKPLLPEPFLQKVRAILDHAEP